METEPCQAGIREVDSIRLQPCSQVLHGSACLLWHLQSLHQQTKKIILLYFLVLILLDLTNGQYSISVRAANAISMLDDVTQDPNMPSHVRVTLWQAVSKLESIRE